MSVFRQKEQYLPKNLVGPDTSARASETQKVIHTTKIKFHKTFFWPRKKEKTVQGRVRFNQTGVSCNEPKDQEFSKFSCKKHIVKIF